MIKIDKNKFSVCIVRGSEKDTLYRHFDTKECTGGKKALEEAQRLANETGRKVVVLTSVFNVYPNKPLTEAQKMLLETVDKIEEVVNG